MENDATYGEKQQALIDVRDRLQNCKTDEDYQNLGKFLWVKGGAYQSPGVVGYFNTACHKYYGTDLKINEWNTSNCKNMVLEALNEEVSVAVSFKNVYSENKSELNYHFHLGKERGLIVAIGLVESLPIADLIIKLLEELSSSTFKKNKALDENCLFNQNFHAGRERGIRTAILELEAKKLYMPIKKVNGGK